jgi:hypothetical protein
MKKISFNSITYVLLHVVVCVFLFAVAINIFIIINDFMGNDVIVENVDKKVKEIFY